MIRSWRKKHGAQGRNRTTDTGIFSAVLYQLSYLGRLAGRPGAPAGAICSSFARVASTRMVRMPSPRAAALSTLGLALAISVSNPAHAWKPATQHAIALDAAAVAPPDLGRQLLRREKAFLAGVDAPLTERDPARHMKNADGSGQLDRVIQAEIDGAIAAIREHRRFDEIVTRFGRLSHWIADANLPLNTANGDRSEGRYFRDFLEYAEVARPRFAVVFYGFGADWRGRGDVAAWLGRSLRRGRELYPALSGEYARIGYGSGIERFDDRSTAFAVAALSYSHAVSDVARAFRYVWIAAGGADPRYRLLRDRDRLVLLRAESVAAAGGP